jgi:hypothetical protein|tara:strand:- start:374 stop:562 length:189 start_codon:yes stop_codon:yes gene_type:complete
MARYHFTKTINALLEASRHIENLCAVDTEYGMHHMTTWKRTLAEATEEIEKNLGGYVRRLKK